MGCTLPVTNCEAERLFSALEHTVNHLQSSISEERLAGLILLHLDGDVDIGRQEVIPQFAENCSIVLFSLITGFLTFNQNDILI